MSDLRTLFISQSYTSLIHTSNDGAVPTGSYIELEDGSGNGLGIEVNRDGNFKIQGEVSASSINGIGNVTAYSSSVDNRLDQLESDTGSQDARIDALTQSVDSLEQFTASLETNFVTSASFQEYTSSTDQKIISLNDFTSSQLTINGGYNSYTQSTDSRLDNIETTTASLQTQIDNIDTGSLLETASFDNGTRDITFTKADSSTFDINIPGADITPLNEFTASQLTINSGYNSFTESTDNRLNTIESETGSFARTDVANNFTGSNNTFPLQFDLRPTNSPASGDPRFRFDSFQNRMQISLIAEDTFFDREIRFYPSSSYSAGFPADSELSLTIKEDEVLAYANKLGLTSNGGNKLATFEISGSTDGDSYVTYLGDNKVMEYNWEADFIIHNNINARGGIDARAKGTFFEGIEVLNGFTASLQEGYFFVGDGTSVTTQIQTSSLFTDTNSRLDNIELTTASLENITTSLSSLTGSYATTGSNTFDGNQRIEADLSVSGSSSYTGSLAGNVSLLTITSETASIDCNEGHFFTLQLVSGSDTHITATNIKPGQTITLQLTQPSVGFGDATFNDTNFNFPRFSQPTLTNSVDAIDIVTFVSFNDTKLNGVISNDLI
jgi:hypothetical protein